MSGALTGRNLNLSQLLLEPDRSLPLATGEQVRVDRERDRWRAVAFQEKRRREYVRQQLRRR